MKVAALSTKVTSGCFLTLRNSDLQLERTEGQGSEQTVFPLSFYLLQAC